MPKKEFFILFALVLFITISGCKKESSSIGTHIQPPGDISKTLYTDTTTLNVFNFYPDSVTTNNRDLSLLGSYTDPVFGLSNASFLTQFNMSYDIGSFGTNPVADSLVLYLKYNSAFYPNNGLSNVPQNIKIYRLIKTIYPDSTYYSNKNVSQYYDSTASQLLADFTFIPSTTDTILRIYLSTAMADTFLSMSSIGLSDNLQFVTNYFKGLYIKASNVYSGGSIIYCDLLSTQTKMVLYYKNSPYTTATNFTFLINSNCSRIGLFHHNSTVPVDTVNQKDLIYLQSMAGTKVKVKFPYIKDYLNKLGSIAIIKAELVIRDTTNAFINEPSYLNPTQLIALMPSITTTPGYSYLPDYNIGTGYFDGNYYSGTPSYYKFNITSYIQKLINGKYTNPGIYLFSALDRTSANRVVLHSGKRTDLNRMKLQITYTKL